MLRVLKLPKHEARRTKHEIFRHRILLNNRNFMSVLLFLIPITLAIGLLGLCCFLWTLKTKQYEDLEGAANRILFDDAEEKNEEKKLQMTAKNS